MKEIWKCIHSWLEANAPKGHGSLRPGASIEAIREAEVAMGLTLPSEVRESYAIHDGQATEPGLIGGEGWCLFSLRAMVNSWQTWSRFDPRFAHRLPVAFGGAGDTIFVELDPGSEVPESVIVQRNDRDEPDPVAPSFRRWLENFTDQLEDGEFVYSEEHGGIVYADEVDMD